MRRSARVTKVSNSLSESTRTLHSLRPQYHSRLYGAHRARRPTATGRIEIGPGVVPLCAVEEDVEEKAFTENRRPPSRLRSNCPFCRTTESYELRWLVRKKKDRLPPGGDERDRAKFQKWQSYMVLLDDKVACKNMRCRKRFDVSGIKNDPRSLANLVIYQM